MWKWDKDSIFYRILGVGGVGLLKETSEASLLLCFSVLLARRHASELRGMIWLLPAIPNPLSPNPNQIEDQSISRRIDSNWGGKYDQREREGGRAYLSSWGGEGDGSSVVGWQLVRRGRRRVRSRTALEWEGGEGRRSRTALAWEGREGRRRAAGEMRKRESGREKDRENRGFEFL